MTDKWSTIQQQQANPATFRNMTTAWPQRKTRTPIRPSGMTLERALQIAGDVAIKKEIK